MDRFFIDNGDVHGDKIIIKGKDVAHISKSLRKEKGDLIELVSNPIIYIARIVEIEAKEISLEIVKRKAAKNEAKHKLRLFQANPKGSKFDLILEKGTEVGIKEFNLISTSRVVSKINNMNKTSKIRRWEKKIEEAAKQSKRDMIPKLNLILDFDDVIENLRGEENIFVAYELENRNRNLKEALREVRPGDINLIIGPEGGFSEEEIEKIKSIGGKSISLGPRILRTETAGIVASSIILYELGDI